MSTRIHPELVELRADMARLTAEKAIRLAREKVERAVNLQRRLDRERTLRALDEILAAGQVPVIVRGGKRLVDLGMIERTVVAATASIAGEAA